MPETLQGAQRSAFLKEERSLDNFLGNYSRAWKYRDARDEFMLSVDFPFRGFHPLWICYTNAGSIVDGEPVLLQLPSTVRDGSKSPVARVRLRDELGNASYLWFSLFESNGQLIEIQKPTDGVGTRLRDRFFRNASTLQAEPVTYQFQLYVQSGSELRADDLDRYFKIYAEALPHAVEQVKRLNAN